MTMAKPIKVEASAPKVVMSPKEILNKKSAEKTAEYVFLVRNMIATEK